MEGSEDAYVGYMTIKVSIDLTSLNYEKKLFLLEVWLAVY